MGLVNIYIAVYTVRAGQPWKLLAHFQAPHWICIIVAGYGSL